MKPVTSTRVLANYSLLRCSVRRAREFLWVVTFCFSGAWFQFHLFSLHPPSHHRAGESGNTVRRKSTLRRPGVIGRTVNCKNKEAYHYVCHPLKNIKGLKPPQPLTVRPTAGTPRNHSFMGGEHQSCARRCSGHSGEQSKSSLSRSSREAPAKEKPDSKRLIGGKTCAQCHSRHTMNTS